MIEVEKFETLFFVKSSLISLYLALTIPIPFISIDNLKILSIVLFILGLCSILNITNDHLDWHRNYSNYLNSKLKIFQNQKNKNFAYLEDLKLITKFKRKKFFICKESCKHNNQIL